MKIEGLFKILAWKKRNRVDGSRQWKKKRQANRQASPSDQVKAIPRPTENIPTCHLPPPAEFTFTHLTCLPTNLMPDGGNILLTCLPSQSD